MNKNLTNKRKIKSKKRSKKYKRSKPKSKKNLKKGGGKSKSVSLTSKKKLEGEKIKKGKIEKVESKARFGLGLGVFGIKKETKEEKVSKMKNKVEDAVRKLGNILNNQVFKYDYVDVESPEIFIQYCSEPFISLDSDGNVVMREVVIVDLEKIPKIFMGNFDSLTYENELGEKISKQAFYRSTGLNSLMAGMWLPFDGISYNIRDNILETRVEKDNFVGRFGGMLEDESNSETKLAIVSQILGGPLWNIKQKLFEVIEYRKYKLNSLLDDIENIIDRDDVSERNKINDFLESVDNIWYDSESDSGELIPNILKYDIYNDLYHDSSTFRLSNGIIIENPNLSVVDVSNNDRLRSAFVINNCIKDSNSLKLDFSKISEGVPTWEELEKELLNREKNGKTMLLLDKIVSRIR